jgi:hypothetical protein
MKKGNIIIPINEVWELLNKPSRFIYDIYEQVKKMPLGEYQYLDFDKETKKELLSRLELIYKTGKLTK